MRVRPTSVTVIGWILVLTGLLSIVQDIRGVVRPRKTATTIESPVPKPISQAISVLGTAMNLVCGYFLLKGKNWARYTEIAWSLAMFTYGYFLSPLPWMLAIGLAIECVMIYLLFRPAANAFFAAENAGLPIANEMSKRQIASIGCYIAAGAYLVGFMISAMFIPTQQSSLMWLAALPFVLLLPGIMILVGRLLSPSSNSAKEVGVVLLASAACAVAFQTSLGVFFSNAEFQKTFMAGKPVPELNFVAGAVTVAAFVWMGGVLWWLGRRSERSKAQTPRRSRNR